MPSDFGQVVPTRLEVDDHVEVCVPTNSQKLIHRIVPGLLKYMQLSTLMSCKSEDLKDVDVVLYSDFMPEKNFVVYLNSNMYGLINYIVVLFFSSKEAMYKQLNKDLYKYSN